MANPGGVELKSSIRVQPSSPMGIPPADLNIITCRQSRAPKDFCSRSRRSRIPVIGVRASSIATFAKTAAIAAVYTFTPPIESQQAPILLSLHHIIFIIGDLANECLDGGPAK